MELRINDQESVPMQIDIDAKGRPLSRKKKSDSAQHIEQEISKPTGVSSNPVANPRGKYTDDGAKSLRSNWD